MSLKILEVYKMLFSRFTLILVAFLGIKTLFALELRTYYTPNKKSCSVSVFYNLADLSKASRLETRITLNHLSCGTEQFTKEEVSKNLFKQNKNVSFAHFETFSCIRIQIPEDMFSQALTVLESMLYRPSFDLKEGSLYCQASHTLFDKYFNAPISLQKMASGRMKKIYQDILKEDRILLVVGASLEHTKIREIVQFKFKKELKKITSGSSINSNQAHNTPTPFQRLSGEILQFSPNIYAQVLALYALGIGKGSTAHQVMREQLFLTYFQQVLLYPKFSGWEPNFIFHLAPTAMNRNLLLNIKNLMLKEIDKWKEIDRQRALGIAASSLLYGVDVSLFDLPRFKGNLSSQEDEDIWKSYALFCIGQAISRKEFLLRLEAVPLEKMKDCSKKIILNFFKQE